VGSDVFFVTLGRRFFSGGDSNLSDSVLLILVDLSHRAEADIRGKSGEWVDAVVSFLERSSVFFDRVSASARLNRIELNEARELYCGLYDSVVRFRMYGLQETEV
jgi:hypothetical protein